NPRAVTPENVARVERASVAGDELAAQTGDPTRFDAPQQLRVKTPVTQILRGQPGGHVFAGTEPLVKRFGLQRDKRESLIGTSRLPFPVGIHTIDLRAAVRAAVVRSERP